jgi:hypothetical protein
MLEHIHRLIRWGRFEFAFCLSLCALSVYAESVGQAADSGAAGLQRLQSQSTAPADSGHLPRVMVRVGKDELTDEHFKQFVRNKPYRRHLVVTQKGRAQVVKEMVKLRLLGIAMEREGLLLEQTGGDKGLLRFRALKQLEAKYFPPPPLPSEEETRAYYAAHKEEFGIPSQVRIRQIHLHLPEHATEPQRQAVRERAEAILRRLDAGEPFAQVAAETTENPRGRANGGDLGFLPLRDDWLRQAVEPLEIGDYSRILESEYGLDIIQLTDSREAVLTPYEQVAGEVQRQMRLEAQEARKTAYLHRLAEEIGVTVVMPGLGDVVP